MFLTLCDILHADLEESAMSIIRLFTRLTQSYKIIKSPDFAEGGDAAMAEAEPKCPIFGNATLKTGANKPDKLEDAPSSPL